MDVYSAIIHDHYRNPRNLKVIADPDLESERLNPSCGDSIKFQASVGNGRIIDIGFSAQGCVISRATASLLSEYVLNKELSEIQSLDSATIKDLIKIELGPVRLKCALLPLQVLQEAIDSYLKKQL